MSCLRPILPLWCLNSLVSRRWHPPPLLLPWCCLIFLYAYSSALPCPAWYAIVRMLFFWWCLCLCRCYLFLACRGRAVIYHVFGNVFSGFSLPPLASEVLCVWIPWAPPWRILLWNIAPCWFRWQCISCSPVQFTVIMSMSCLVDLNPISLVYCSIFSAFACGTCLRQ